MPKIVDIDPEVLADLCEAGYKHKEMVEIFGISAPTLSKRIASIQQKQGVLLQYRALQSLQLTELQARVLEAITPGKIREAPLKDLVLCFKILKDKELVAEGKPSDIRGLVGYLIQLEKEEAALKNVTVDDSENRSGDIIDLEAIKDMSLNNDYDLDEAMEVYG